MLFTPRRLGAFTFLGTALVILGWWLWHRAGHSQGPVAHSRGDIAVPEVGRPITRPGAQPAVLERGLHEVATAEGRLPRDRWDPAYVAARLGNDPDTIFDWVRRSTYWVPYRGVLRGPQGVLMDRQGNDLDRALLLSALLRVAGHTTRLARSQLSSEQAAHLLPLLIARRHRPEPLSYRSALDDVTELRRAMVQGGIAQPGLVERMQSRGQRMLRVIDSLGSRTAAQSARLISLVGHRPDSSEWTARRDSAANVLRDHWWVQLQRPSGWVNLDPDAREATPLIPEETVAENALDSSLYHRVSVRLVVERWDGRALREQVALAHEVQGPETWDRALELRIMPTAWPSDLERQGTDFTAAVRAAALAQKSWRATLLADGDVVADVVVRESGETGSATGGGPMGGLGRGIAGALGANQSAGTLTAAWLEYEIHVPAQPAEMIRRPLFDLVGASARTARITEAPAIDETKRLQRSLALLRRTEILPLSSALAPTFVLHLGGQGLLRNQELLRAAANGELSDSTSASVPGPKPLPSQLYALALVRFESKDTADVYLDRPNILTRHTLIALTPRGLRVREATDIVANYVAVELGERDGFGARLRQGVRDTNAEAILPETRSFGAVALAFTEGSRWVVADSARGATLSEPQDVARHYLTADLRKGYIVVAPDAVTGSGSQDFAGWWRIDPRTGHTLGMAPSGWGQSLVERVAIAIVSTWAFEYLICRGAFTWTQQQQALAPPFPLSLATLLAAETEKRECSINAAISGFIVAGAEIFAVTWPLVVRTLAGRGYSGFLTGQPLFASGEPEPGDLPPIFGEGSSPPKPDCLPGGGIAAGSNEAPAAAPEASAAEPPAGSPGEGEGAQPGGTRETPSAPGERDWPTFDPPGPTGLQKPGAHGPTPVNPDGADAVARQSVMDADHAEGAVDEAAVAVRRATEEYEGLLREQDLAAARDKDLYASSPGSKEYSEAREDFLAKARTAADKRTQIDKLEDELAAAKRALETARYKAYMDNRIAQANRKAYAAGQEADEAAKDWGGVDYDSPKYARWRDAVERFRQAGRELTAAMQGEPSPAEATTDKTFLAPMEPAAPKAATDKTGLGPTEPAVPKGAEVPPPGAPASNGTCSGAAASPAAHSVGGAPPAGAGPAVSPAAKSVAGPPAPNAPVSPAAQSVAGAAAVGVGVGGVP